MTTTPDAADITWRKSSYSNGEGGACLEVSGGHQSHVGVRDSKVPDRPSLVFPPRAWAAFVAGISTTE